jgi:hypothetical protein
VVPDHELGVEPHQVPSVAKAPVELVVLVAHQRLVETADAAQHVCVEHAEVRGVGRALGAAVVEPGVADTEA